MRLDGKIAIIIGAGQGPGEGLGNGRATALRFAREGARILAVDRNLASAEETATMARKEGGDCIAFAADVTSEPTLKAAVAAAAERWGRVDILHYNVGVSLAGGDASPLEITEEAFDRVAAINLRGTVMACKHVLPIMRRQRSGHIIQVSSVAGRLSAPLLSSYSASKFALEGWSEALRVEVHSLGIRVVLIEPGDYDTDIWTRNVVIGKQAQHPSSPNRERSQRFVEFIKSRAPKRRDPREVAQLIVRVAKEPNPKLRYVIGPDAKMHLRFRALIPWRKYERIVAKATKID